MSIDVINDVPLPKKEDFDWNKISHREVRVTLIDLRSKKYLSNTLILSVKWEQLYETKWLIGSDVEKTFLLNSSYD